MNNLLTHAPERDGRVETLSWRTALSTSRNGSELREATRAHPRFQFSASYLTSAALRLGSTDEPVLVALHHLPAMAVSTPFGWRYGFPHATTPFTWCIARRADGNYEVLQVDSAGFFPLDGYTSCVAAVPCRLLSDVSRDVILKSLHRVSLSFESTEPFPFYSPLASLGGPGSPDGSPLIAPSWLAHNFSTALKDASQRAMRSFDAGFVREDELLYAKRVLSLNLTLFGEPQVHAFRKFVCELRGAAGEFRWTPPGGAEGRWRLGSDSVAITHITRAVAECALSIVELK